MEQGSITLAKGMSSVIVVAAILLGPHGYLLRRPHTPFPRAYH